MRRLLIITTLSSVLSSAQTVTPDDFRAQLNAGLDLLINVARPAAQQKVLFSANLVHAQGSFYPFFPTSALLAYVSGLRAAGAQRIDVNVGLEPWRSNDAAGIAKYDELFRFIRGSGMQLAINPESIRGQFTIGSFTDWQNAALPVYATLAQRYKPDVFVLMHEPTTMAARMGITTTPEQWREFVVAAAAMVRRESPRTMLAAGGLATELAYYQEFARIPDLNFLTLDIYSLRNIAVYEQMIGMARAARKEVYIEETWRPPYIADPSATTTLETASAESIGEASYQALDAKWMEAMTLFASAGGLKAVTPFWTQTFFLLSSNTGGGLNPTYNLNSAQEAAAGRLSENANRYRELAGQYALPVVSTVSSASYINAILSPEALASTFGANLGAGLTPAAAIPLPVSLANATVNVIDSTNTSRPAELYVVSIGQINFVVPRDSAAGPATVRVRTSDGRTVDGVALIENVAPGLISANADGRGVAAAIVARANGSFEYVYQCGAGAGSCQPTPITIGSPADSATLVLFGTGFRRTSNVRVRIGTVTLTATYAGAQAQYPGLDQVNIPLPQNLIAAGRVTVQLTADGVNSNEVVLEFR